MTVIASLTLIVKIIVIALKSFNIMLTQILIVRTALKVITLVTVIAPLTVILTIIVIVITSLNLMATKILIVKKALNFSSLLGHREEKRREGHVYCSLSKMSTSPTQMLSGAKSLPDLREITESSSFLSVSKVFGAGSTNLSMHLVPNSRSASVETSTSNASKNTNTASIGPPSMLTTEDVDTLMFPARKQFSSKG
mgnify:CR=1 FL=1